MVDITNVRYIFIYPLCYADISIVYLHTFDFTVDIQTRLDLFQTKHFCFQVKMFSLGNWPGSFSGGGVTPVYCEAQGKGRARDGPRKVTQRSFMDGGWWMVDILSLMLYTKFGCHPPPATHQKFNLI